MTALDLPDLVRPKGVWRDQKLPCSLILSFSEVPTDDDMRAWHEAADTLAAVADERKDWARRFKLNGLTPWDWMTRAERAEASGKAWEIMCGGKQKIIEKLERERDEAVDDRERLTDNVCAVVQENEQLRINAERAEAEVARLTQERDTLTDYLLRHGFVRCDIPACNCGSWHHRYGLPERWDELKDDIAEAGHPLCNANGNNLRNAMGQLVAERDKLRRVVEAAQEMRSCYMDVAPVDPPQSVVDFDAAVADLDKP